MNRSSSAASLGAATEGTARSTAAEASAAMMLRRL